MQYLGAENDDIVDDEVDDMSIMLSQNNLRISQINLEISED